MINQKNRQLRWSRMGKNKLGLGIENKRMRTARKGKEKTSSPEELERKNKKEEKKQSDDLTIWDDLPE